MTSRAWWLVPALIGVGAGLAFLLPTVGAYDATPSDPQKPIGYLFIGAYSFLIAALFAGAVAFGLLTFRRTTRPSGRIVFATFGLLCAIAALALFIDGYASP